MARQLDVETATPELRHEFCDLWNQLVVGTQVRRQNPVLRSNAMLILSFIRTIYIPMHQDTESHSLSFLAYTGNLDPVLQDVSSHSQCTVSSHHLVTFANPYASVSVAPDAGLGDA